MRLHHTGNPSLCEGFGKVWNLGTTCNFGGEKRLCCTRTGVEIEQALPPRCEENFSSLCSSSKSSLALRQVNETEKREKKKKKKKKSKEKKKEKRKKKRKEKKRKEKRKEKRKKKRKENHDSEHSSTIFDDHFMQIILKRGLIFFFFFPLPVVPPFFRTTNQCIRRFPTTMTKVNKENIVSIQSQVFDGFCGNNIASFVLRRRGHVPKILSTVQYYSKYKHCGVELKCEDINTILREFSTYIETYLDSPDSKIYFLTGYIKAKDCVEAVTSRILELKKKKKKEKTVAANGSMVIDSNGHVERSANCHVERLTNCHMDESANYVAKVILPECRHHEECLIENLVDQRYFWMCDPVMGDHGRLYVDSDVVGVYKNFISHVDIITPNQFELELLCDIKICTEKDVIACLTHLLNKGVRIAIVTSVHYNFDINHLYLYVGFLNKKKELICYKYKIFRFDFDVCGSGDLFASLLLSFIVKKKKKKKKNGTLHPGRNVIKNSLGSVELKIIGKTECSHFFFFFCYFLHSPHYCLQCVITNSTSSIIVTHLCNPYNPFLENQDIIAGEGTNDRLIEGEPVFT
ncbi:pyridoxal kinase, putative (PDXK) [Plasmodium ovale wallikeri]|uniref:pyridoxal kinase n=1 Tax=Plasmodium ovale wallikeri TaxID=864142 RepID=A0A1A8Z5K3_PLAOA|nr:pyridoxal kinase, putative (PDXK) [Plasmodium ovale wallikeri]